MRIALVVTGGLYPGGREQVIPVLLTLVASLSKNHSVDAFVLKHLERPCQYSLCGATIHDLGRPGGRLRQARALLTALQLSGPFDVLHGIWADPAGAVAAYAGRRLGIPTVVTVDSGEFVSIPELEYGSQRTFVGRRLVAFACRTAQRVHVTTAYMQALASRSGIDSTRIPLGIDVARFAEAGHPPAGPPWRLLQVASLNEVKDQTMLLRAIDELRSSFDVRLDLVGGDALDGRVHREAATLGLDGIVTFHGFVPHDQLGDFHRRAHVYVQSSRHEAGGVAVLEAAAAGLPIVGTRVGYVSDWHGSAALGVPPGDDVALASALASVLSDYDRRRALGEAARARALDYDAHATTERMVALYDAVRGAPGTPR
jgi:glycosyltransferase involved in cell wall biosynthesis